MTFSLVLFALLLCVVLGLTSFVQLLYLESLRLRSRDSDALLYFRETLQERLGLKPDRGTLTFSLVKHTSLLLLGIAVLLILSPSGTATWPLVLEAALFAWLAMILFAYVLPQMLYRKTSAHWLTPLTPVLRVFATLMKPLISVLAFLQSLAELGEPEEETNGNGKQTESIDALIDAGAEEGLIEEDDRRLIHSVVAFGDKTVREVMTPRPNIVAISIDKTLEDLRHLVINEQYSRIPVFEGSIDNILGFVHVRDMFELDEDERARKQVTELIREIRFVPETKPVNDMLREMQESGAHMVIVVDEYGNTAGLATMEDVVEEILGEIRDEHEPTLDVTREPDGSYVVSGSYDLDHLHELLGFRPHEETESTTVGGLVTEWLGRVPQPGESVERDGIRIDVLAGNELRVEQVRIARSTGTVHA